MRSLNYSANGHLTSRHRVPIRPTPDPQHCRLALTMSDNNVLLQNKRSSARGARSNDLTHYVQFRSQHSPILGLQQAKPIRKGQEGNN
ncbi:hypothetical protein [Puniceicoccus vermicola]|uniref:hypothetical protein n=1 Tax=Puniceicoccus vermicola TaxID=388746 RepID=UPI00339B3003